MKTAKSKVTKTKLRRATNHVLDLMDKLKKELFVLEVMQSEWEHQHGFSKEIKSVDEYIDSLMKRA